VSRKLVPKLKHKAQMIYGYARVSTLGQTLDAQLDQLKAAGCARIYREKETGAKSDLRERGRLLNALNPGDVLIVTRLDRFARSTRDLLNMLDDITAKKAEFRCLGNSWDTKTPEGRLMITVLGGIAEFERELIRLQTSEGRVRAKARGQHMGRPSKLTPAQQHEARQRIAEGASVRELARSYNVGKSTISRLRA
jgi:DNA invertase Pin-like site-specific DNA recombinase